MKEEWLFRGALVPVDVETTAALVAEIKRLIDVVGGMALAQPEQEPVAWIHNFIEGGISIGKRPSDLNRHPDRWTALYRESKPCPTCEALARTVMLDQTSHDTKRPWAGLTAEKIAEVAERMEASDPTDSFWREFARAIEAAHNIGVNT